MKKYIIILGISLYLIPTIGFGYTPPATWDPSGSHSKSQNTGDYTCSQLKGMYGETYQAMYRAKGCNKKPVNPVHPIKPIKPVYPQPVQQPYDGDHYWKQKYRIEKQEWARSMSSWVIDTWTNIIYVNRQRLSGYLSPEMMNDIHQNGYMFRDQLNECLAKKIYNDFENTSNMQKADRKDRFLNWTAGMLRDCHRKLRRPIP